MYLGLTPWDNVLGQRFRTASWGEILGGQFTRSQNNQKAP